MESGGFGKGLKDAMKAVRDTEAAVRQAFIDRFGREPNRKLIAKSKEEREAIERCMPRGIRGTWWTIQFAAPEPLSGFAQESYCWAYAPFTEEELNCLARNPHA